MWKVTSDGDWDNCLNSKEIPDFSVIWDFAQNNNKNQNNIKEKDKRKQNEENKRKAQRVDNNINEDKATKHAISVTGSVNIKANEIKKISREKNTKKKSKNCQT